ncbi:CRE-MAA-1 protein [Caenorhabditis remanei]|uniref:CRE-MAA-1 protein n=1 Tax=Caenorhabditis remanei TaxID=31234 RepID=E3MI56_CAERE|nr:CRE-MAA-1 protein [Caenorhabditis remanei]
MSKFETAVFIVQNLPKDGPVKTSTDEKLNFYGLFKQATHGKCDVSKPSFFDVQGVYKWNAWNKLDTMTSEDAKNAYVDAIVQKIRDAQKTYKTEEWMKGDAYDLLAPKFEILGILESSSENNKLEGSTKNEKIEERLENEPIGKQDTKEGEEVEKGNNETVDSSACILSDNEYADAIDDELQSRSSSFTEPHTSSRIRVSPQSSPTIRNSCHRLEKELKVITESIDKLGKAVEERHNLLIGLMKKATVYILVPKATSWKTVIFFVFWPFVANFLLRWIRRFLTWI